MVGIIISGLPASGKGTQAARVAAEYDFVHIDTGESLRKEVDRSSDLGREIQQYIIKGELVPDNTIEELVSRLLDKNQGHVGVVFDGFPRSIAQAEILEKLSLEYHLQVKGMICLDVTEQEIRKRIRKRAQEEERSDDQNKEAILKRIEEQKKQLKKLTDHYQKKNMLFKVNGNGSIKEVFDQVKATVEKNNLAVNSD